MLYYLGKGMKCKKEECKEYKTLKNALAAAKDETLIVWDENGVVVGGLTDNVPEGALNTNSDGSVNAYDENGNLAGTVDAATVAEMTGNEPETAENDEKKDETMNRLNQKTPEMRRIQCHRPERMAADSKTALSFRRVQ